MPRTDRAAAREAFVQIAARRFAEDGFAATSLRDIATESGYSKAAILYHFRSKTDLLTAVVEDKMSRIEALTADLESMPPGPERLNTAIDTLVGILVAERPIPSMVLTPSHDVLVAVGRLPVARRLDEVRQRIKTVFAGADPSPQRQIQVSAALAGTHAGAAEFPDIDADLLHRSLVTYLRAALTQPSPNSSF